MCPLGTAGMLWAVSPKSVLCMSSVAPGLACTLPSGCPWAARAHAALCPQAPGFLSVSLLTVSLGAAVSNVSLEGCIPAGLTLKSQVQLRSISFHSIAHPKAQPSQAPPTWPSVPHTHLPLQEAALPPELHPHAAVRHLHPQGGSCVPEGRHAVPWRRD